MIEALKRLWQAIRQLGSGQDGNLPVVGGDLMQQVGAMQTYWRAFLQERLQDGAGYGADSVAMTDVEQFMMPGAENAVPDATLADLDESLNTLEPDAHPDTDGTDWLDYLNASGDDDSLDDLALPDGA